MKNLLMIGLLLGFASCEMTSEPTALVQTEITRLDQSGFSVSFDTLGTRDLIFDNGVYLEGAQGQFVVVNRGGCNLTAQNECELMQCNGDTIVRKFCNVQKWSIDSVSFTYNDSLFKGRYFK